MSGFVEDEWPGRCIAERFAAWAAALWKDPPVAVDAYRMVREERRQATREHVDCSFHPPLDFWPAGWFRNGNAIRYTVCRSDGSETVEDVAADSARDIELQAAYEKYRQWPAPSTSSASVAH